jgi:hypothetical protein
MPLKPGYKLYRVTFEGELVVAAKDEAHAQAYVELEMDRGDIEIDVTSSELFDPMKFSSYYDYTPHEADKDANPQYLTISELQAEEEEVDAISEYVSSSV